MLAIEHPRCAGLDVHQRSITSAGSPSVPEGSCKESRTFGTMTRDPLALADWLTQSGVTHVVMESTGVYWKPVYNLLEGSLPCCWSNPNTSKRSPAGRRTFTMPSGWRTCGAG
jgi:transposase